MTKRQVLFLLSLIWFDAELFHRAGASDDDSSPKWQTVNLIEEEGYSFRLRHLNKASIADEKWLELECENRNSPMVFLDNIHFRIEYETQPSGYPAGGLVWAAPYQLFPWAWDSRPIQIKIDQGHTRTVFEPLSNQGSGRLGEAPASGLTYIGRVHLTVDVSFGHGAGRTLWKTPLHGVPFRFDWVRPDEAGYARMRLRLKYWLHTPGHRVSSYETVVQRMFEIPNVTDELSTAKLVTAIDEQQVPSDARVSAIRCLFERDARELVELGFDRDKLVHDQNVIAVLKGYAWPKHPERLWCSGFAKPLVQVLSSRELSVDVKDQAVEVLLRFPNDWQSNPLWVKQIEAAKQQRDARRRQRDVEEILLFIGPWGVGVMLGVGAILLVVRVRRRRAPLSQPTTPQTKDRLESRDEMD